MAVICPGMDFLCGIKACLPFDRSPLRQNDTALLTDAGGGSTFGLWTWMKICHVELMITLPRCSGKTLIHFPSKNSGRGYLRCRRQFPEPGKRPNNQAKQQKTK